MPESQGERGQAPTHKDRFRYDAATDTFICPREHSLRLQGTIHRTGRPTVRRYRMVDPRHCRVCSLFGTCTTSQRHGRTLELGPENTRLRDHRAWMATEPAETLRRERQTLIEPVFGILKEVFGGRLFHVRGLANVRAEWSLLATAFNLRTLWRTWRRTMRVGSLMLE